MDFTLVPQTVLNFSCAFREHCSQCIVHRIWNTVATSVIAFYPKILNVNSQLLRHKFLRNRQRMHHEKDYLNRLHQFHLRTVLFQRNSLALKMDFILIHWNVIVFIDATLMLLTSLLARVVYITIRRQTYAIFRLM